MRAFAKENASVDQLFHRAKLYILCEADGSLHYLVISLVSGADAGDLHNRAGFAAGQVPVDAAAGFQSLHAKPASIIIPSPTSTLYVSQTVDSMLNSFRTTQPVNAAAAYGMTMMSCNHVLQEC